METRAIIIRDIAIIFAAEFTMGAVALWMGA